MASSLTAIHDRIIVLVGALTDVASVSDEPEDYDQWEESAMLPGVRTPAAHVKSSSEENVATTDGDLKETVTVEVSLLLSQKGSGKSRMNALIDAMVTSLYGDATLWGLCDNVTPKGRKVKPKVDKFHRITATFEIEHTWTPA